MSAFLIFDDVGHEKDADASFQVPERRFSNSGVVELMICPRQH